MTFIMMDVYAFYLLRFWARTEKNTKSWTRTKAFFPYYFLVYGLFIFRNAPWIHWKDQKNCVFLLGLITFWTLSKIFVLPFEIKKKIVTQIFLFCFSKFEAPKMSKTKTPNSKPFRITKTPLLLLKAKYYPAKKTSFLQY